MEDGTKEDPAQQNDPKFLCKAGWLKKAPSRLLASYKSCYIHVEKTEIAVYENEDLQNCTERLDLGNYDKCYEIKSPFKRKHRLILICSPKSRNKVHDVKFQAQTAEEKEDWIKALSDGINRAKNKVFDEVKVDESNNLEHVTRTRPKGNRNRRPPTRIHMKEVADVSSDGILRLDLDLEDAVMPNGSHLSVLDGTESHRDTTNPTPQSTTSQLANRLLQYNEDGGGTEPDASTQKKVTKPPMPPTKDSKLNLASKEDLDVGSGPNQKVIIPPMPSAKEAKPCDTPAEASVEKSKPGPPPTPPNKPSNRPTENWQSGPNSPTPESPSEDKKPCHPPVKPESQTTDQDDQDEEADNRKETPQYTDEVDQSISEKTPPHTRNNVPEPDSSGTNGKMSEEEAEGAVSDKMMRFDSKPQIFPEPQRRSLSPETKPAHPDLIPFSETFTTPPSPEDVLPRIQVPMNEPLTDSLSLSPELHHVCGEKNQKVEEKSAESEQHSDDESDASSGEDTLAASTAALRGSHAGLDSSEDDVQTDLHLRPDQARNKPQVRPKTFSSTAPLKPLAKARSASSGDLLSKAVVFIQPSRAEDHHDKLMKLEREVALEMAKTSELLSTASQAPTGADEEDRPRDLLARALEKLKKADYVLREINKLKVTKGSHNRKSW